MLTILDLEDAESRALERLDAMEKRFMERFYQPVDLTAASLQLQAMVAPVDQEAAREIRRILGGRDDGKSQV